MYIYYIQYIMPKYNNNRLSKNTKVIKPTSPSNTSSTSQPTNSTYNTIKDAVIYSTVFSGTQRLMDGILGNRKVDVVEKNDYCDKIKEKYNNDKYNEFLKDEYEKCYK